MKSIVGITKKPRKAVIILDKERDEQREQEEQRDIPGLHPDPEPSETSMPAGKPAETQHPDPEPGES